MLNQNIIGSWFTYYLIACNSLYRIISIRRPMYKESKEQRNKYLVFKVKYI